MYIRSENCPRGSRQVAGGIGMGHMKILAGLEQTYQHIRLFNHVTLDPGCTFGYHAHDHETEFFYILKGDPVFNDDGQEVTLHPGDVAETGYGQSHSLENRTDTPVELIALIVLE